MSRSWERLTVSVKVEAWRFKTRSSRSLHDFFFFRAKPRYAFLRCEANEPRTNIWSVDKRKKEGENILEKRRDNVKRARKQQEEIDAAVTK